MRYRDLDIDFERIFVIYDHELEAYKDCVVLDTLVVPMASTTYADVGVNGPSPVQGNAPSFFTETKFLVGRTKAGAALYEKNTRN